MHALLRLLDVPPLRLLGSRTRRLRPERWDLALARRPAALPRPPRRAAARALPRPPTHDPLRPSEPLDSDRDGARADGLPAGLRHGVQRGGTAHPVPSLPIGDAKGPLPGGRDRSGSQLLSSRGKRGCARGGAAEDRAPPKSAGLARAGSRAPRRVNPGFYVKPAASGSDRSASVRTPAG